MVMAIPSGAHLGSWPASAVLKEPLRSDPEIAITFSLSAIFKSSNFPGPGSREELSRRFGTGEPLALQIRLADEPKHPIEAVFRPCYCRENRGRTAWLAIRKKSV